MKKKKKRLTIFSVSSWSPPKSLEPFAFTIHHRLHSLRALPDGESGSGSQLLCSTWSCDSSDPLAQHMDALPCSMWTRGHSETFIWPDTGRELALSFLDRWCFNYWICPVHIKFNRELLFHQEKHFAARTINALQTWSDVSAVMCYVRA